MKYAGFMGGEKNATSQLNLATDVFI